jgi:5'-3' exonuclease
MVDLVIDSPSLFTRAWHATMGPGDGDPQEAIRSSLITMLLLLDTKRGRLDEKVDRILLCWDGDTRRDKGRGPKPKEFYEARDLFIDMVSLLFSPAHGYSEVHEADDVIATAVENAGDNLVYIVTGDKDLHQLQDPRVLVYCLNQKSVLSRTAIISRWKIKQPSQLAIALAILGDKIDGIAGIKGWGPARVAKLFQAVSSDMTFAKALDAIATQIPPQHIDGFWRDLELTLLDHKVPGIPEPAPITLALPEVVDELRFKDFMGYYCPVYERYEKVVPRSGEEDTEDVPTLVKP